jgi:hypothetical protein
VIGRRPRGCWRRNCGTTPAGTTWWCSACPAAGCLARSRSRALDAPVDVFLVRKLGVPGHEEARSACLDLYSLHRSLAAVVEFLEQPDPDAAERARQRYARFDQFDAVIHIDETHAVEPFERTS